MYIVCGKLNYELVDDKRYLVLDTDTCEVKEEFGSTVNQAKAWGVPLENVALHVRKRGYNFNYISDTLPPNKLIKLEKWQALLCWDKGNGVFQIYCGGTLFKLTGVYSLGIFKPSEWGVLMFDGMKAKFDGLYYQQRAVTFDLNSCGETLRLYAGTEIKGKKMSFEEALKKVVLELL